MQVTKSIRFAPFIVDPLHDPYRHLFLFAVLNKFYEMADFFWNEGEEQIPAALTAATIYRNMAQKLPGDNVKLIEESK